MNDQDGKHNTKRTQPVLQRSNREEQLKEKQCELFFYCDEENHLIRFLT